MRALNSGSLLIDYQGHGAEQQWSFSNYFNSDDAAVLTNGGRLPVYLLMDCLNGFFQDVYAQSLAESILLAPNGGGIAGLGLFRLHRSGAQASMNLALLRSLALHPNDPIGKLIFQAKAGTTDKDVRRTWILFGDPSLNLQIKSIPAAPAATSPKPSVGEEHPRDSIRPCGRDSVCSREKLKL